MAKRDLSGFLDDTIEYESVVSSSYPDGKTYVVRSPSSKTGVWLTALAELGLRAARGGDVDEADLDSLKLDDEQEITLYKHVLGSVYDEMIADGVPWTTLQKHGEDAYIYFAMSPQMADAALENLGKEQPQPNRATRRTTPRRGGSKSSPASGGIPARTRGQASIPSSTSPTVPAAEAV